MAMLNRSVSQPSRPATSSTPPPGYRTPAQQAKTPTPVSISKPTIQQAPEAKDDLTPAQKDAEVGVSDEARAEADLKNAEFNKIVAEQEAKMKPIEADLLVKRERWQELNKRAASLVGAEQSEYIELGDNIREIQNEYDALANYYTSLRLGAKGYAIPYTGASLADINKATEQRIELGKGGESAFAYSVAQGLIPKDAVYVPKENNDWGYMTKGQWDSYLKELQESGIALIPKTIGTDYTKLQAVIALNQRDQFNATIQMLVNSNVLTPADVKAIGSDQAKLQTYVDAHNAKVDANNTKIINATHVLDNVPGVKVDSGYSLVTAFGAGVSKQVMQDAGFSDDVISQSETDYKAVVQERTNPGAAFAAMVVSGAIPKGAVYSGYNPNTREFSYELPGKSTPLQITNQDDSDKVWAVVKKENGLPSNTKLISYDNTTGQFSYELPPEKLTDAQAQEKFAGMVTADPVKMSGAVYKGYNSDTGEITYTQSTNQPPQMITLGQPGLQTQVAIADAKSHLGFTSPDGKTFVEDVNATDTQRKWVRTIDPKYLKSVADSQAAVIKVATDKWLAEQYPVGATAAITLSKTARSGDVMAANDAAFSANLKEFALNQIPGRSTIQLVKNWNSMNVYDQIGAVSGEVANYIMLGLMVKAPVGRGVTFVKTELPGALNKVAVGLDRVDLALGKLTPRLPTAAEVGVGLSKVRVGLGEVYPTVKSFALTTPDRMAYGLEAATNKVIAVAKRAVVDAKLAPVEARRITEKLDRIAFNYTQDLIKNPTPSFKLTGQSVKINADKLLVTVKKELSNLSPAELSRVSRRLGGVVDTASNNVFKTLNEMPEAGAYKFEGAIKGIAGAAKSEINKLKLAPGAAKRAFQRIDQVAFEATQRAIKNPAPTFGAAARELKVSTAKIAGVAKSGIAKSPAEISRITKLLNGKADTAINNAFKALNALPEASATGFEALTQTMAKVAQKSGAVTLVEARKVVSVIKRTGTTAFTDFNAAVKKYGGSIDDIVSGKMTKQTAKALKYALQDMYKSRVSDPINQLRQYATDIRVAMQDADKALAIKIARKAEALSAQLDDKVAAEQIAGMFKKVRTEAAKAPVVSPLTKTEVAQVKKQVEAQVRQTLNELYAKTRKLKPSDIGKVTPEMEAGQGVKSGTKPYKHGETPVKPKPEEPPPQAGKVGETPKETPPPKGGGVAVKEKTETKTEVKKDIEKKVKVDNTEKTKPMTEAEFEKLMGKNKPKTQGFPGITTRTKDTTYQPRTEVGTLIQEDVVSSMISTGSKTATYPITRTVTSPLVKLTDIPSKTKAGQKIEVLPVTKIGKAVGVEIKTVTGVTPKISTLTQNGIKAGIKTETKAGVKAAVQTGVQSLTKTGVETGVKTGIETGIKTGLKTGVTTAVTPAIKIRTTTIVKPPFPLPRFDMVSDASKRSAIKSSAAAFCWQQGQLHNKRVWHVVALIKGSWVRIIVLGAAPEGAAIVKPGRGQPQRSITLLYGLAPAQTQRFPVGFVDAVITPSPDRTRVTLRFVANDYNPTTPSKNRANRRVRGVTGKSRRTQKAMPSVGGLRK